MRDTADIARRAFRLLCLLGVGLSLPLVSHEAAASPSGGTGEESRCSFPGERGGRVELVLEGMEWRGWERLCDDLGTYARPGRPPWSEETAPLTARLLEETGFFSAAECGLHSGNTVMECRLVPARIVDAVKFSGDVPSAVLIEDLRRRVFLRPGTLLGEQERESIERQRRRLEDYLRREGYFGTSVRIRPALTGGARPNEGVRLDARVIGGRTVRLRNVEIHGDPPLEHSEVVSRLTHKWFLWWFPKRFTPLQFEEDLEDLTRLLFDRGYPEARVTGDWRLDLPNESVDVVLRIEAGPRLVLDFEGNRRLRSRHLRELVTFEEAGIVDAVEMEDVAKAIRSRYQEVGHDACEVTLHHEEPGDGTLRVTYRIEEGPRRFLSRIAFVGNEAFSDAEIRDRASMMTGTRGLLGGGQWVDSWVEADVRSIQAFYRRQGHGAASVTAKKRVLSDGGLEARFEIVEGPIRVVGSMEIEGLPEEIDRDALLDRLVLTRGRPFVEENAGRDYREILATLAEQGHTRGEVEQIMERPSAQSGGAVDIRYVVVPGPKSRLGGVLIRGNFRTSRRLIEDQLGISAGDDLNLVALGQARRRLRSLGPFSSVDLQPLDAWRGEEDVWLLVELQERDARTLDGVLTFSTEDRLSFGADYQDRNLFGRAVRLDLRLRLGRVLGDVHPWMDFVGNADKFDGQLRAPRPWGLPFDVEGTAFYRHEDKPNFTEERLGIGAGAVRELSSRQACSWCPDVIGKLRYEVAAGVIEDRSGAETVTAGSGRANVGRVVPSLTFDRRDAFVDPTSGYTADIRLELANDALAPIGSGHDFLRLVAGGQVFVRAGTPMRRRLRGDRFLGGPLVLAGSATFGGATPYGSSTELPDAETFYYGGDYSVRGLTSRASRAALPGAAFMVVSNLEARWYLLDGFGFGTVQLAAFADLGTVSSSFGELFDELTLSVGPALRYVTPVGPISLSWGIPVIVPDAIAEEMSDSARRNGRLHLTFGYTF